MPLDANIKRVLVVGSGPIVIGQAAEFDYAGTQACRALKEEGLEVILVNSNPATIMTDRAMADSIYIEPLTLTTLTRIIEKEKPDSLLSTLGGQTGLTLSMQLAREGVLAANGVRLLGANPATIEKAEDRQLFKETMLSLGEPVIPSQVVTDISAALAFAGEIGYPVIVRPAFTLGGSGGGIGSGVGPYVPGNGVKPPVVLSQPLPYYTEEARKARAEGIVLLQLVVRKDGTPDSFKVLRGLGYGLDESAISTVANKWRFRPGTYNGVPADVQILIEVSFRLY